MNKVQEIAKRRLEEIAYAEKRIKAKIAAGHPRSEYLKKRLAEYETSKAALAIELETGAPVKIKDKKQMALLAVASGKFPPPVTKGVSVEVPPGLLNMGGK